MSQTEHIIGHGIYVKIPIKISNCKVPYNEPSLVATSPSGFREEGWNVKKTFTDVDWRNSRRENLNSDSQQFHQYQQCFHDYN